MTVTILPGDCRDVLCAMPAESVHCCVTSPPYFGLRSYLPDGHPDKAKEIGLEPTPAGFVTEMVAVFREVRRVLRADGTLWLNLGDSYASNPGQGTRGGPPSKSSTLEGNGHRGGGPKLAALSRVGVSGNKGNAAADVRFRQAAPGLKPKDLIGIPWRVAFALQADGWWLRQDIIWSKPNPMPESITDRCTKAHEYLFLMSKSERYHYDADAIAEGRVSGDDECGTGVGWGRLDRLSPVVVERGRDRIKRVRGTPPRHAQYESSDQSGLDEVGRGGKRNKRSVWTVATQPFPEAHFATFPTALIEPCIKAGCPSGGMVLDPFGGAGTTGLVADRLGRSATLIELHPDYPAMARRRIAADAGMFSPISEAAE